MLIHRARVRSIERILRVRDDKLPHEIDTLARYVARLREYQG